MKDKSLQEGLKVLLETSQDKESLTLGEMLKIFSGRGRIVLLIFLSLPFCQPIQIPGFSTPFGLLIAFIGLRMAFGKRAFLPKKLRQKKISSKTVQKISQKGLKYIEKLRPFIHPRLFWLSQPKGMKIFNALLISLLGIFLALPLPIPLTNLVSGWAILLMSIGLLEDDGVFILAGYSVTLLTIVFFILLEFSIRSLVKKNG